METTGKNSKEWKDVHEELFYRFIPCYSFNTDTYDTSKGSVSQHPTLNSQRYYYGYGSFGKDSTGPYVNNIYYSIGCEYVEKKYFINC